MTLPSPDLQATDALDRFRAWWRGLGDLMTIGDSQYAELLETVAREAYLQGQIDGGARALRLFGQVAAESVSLDWCRFCGAPLAPCQAPTDPVVQELGRFCSRCLADQTEARDLMQ